MKKLLDLFKGALERIEEIISNRVDYYDERSEEWQDSDKGSEYDEKTDELRNIQDEVQQVYDSLELYLNS